MVQDKSFRGVAGKVLIYAVLSIAALCCILPFIYIFLGSFVSQEELIRNGGFVLIPKEISFESYEYVFHSDSIFRGIGIAVFITLVGTTLNIVLTSITAYALSKPTLPGRKFLMLFVTFPMIFSGGMIPTFLVVRMLGLTDTYWSLILPGAILSFNLIVMRNFFQAIPVDYEEAATIDGCSEFATFVKIILPLSKPSIATFTLFYGVTHWNSYLPAILYINNTEKWPLQVWLRQIVVLSLGNNSFTNMGEGTTPPMQSIKFAVIIIAVIPILIAYPFVQRYFTQGMMVGGIKG